MIFTSFYLSSIKQKYLKEKKNNNKQQLQRKLFYHETIFVNVKRIANKHFRRNGNHFNAIDKVMS